MSILVTVLVCLAALVLFGSQHKGGRIRSSRRIFGGRAPTAATRPAPITIMTAPARARPGNR